MMNEAMNVLLGRRSIRSYRPEPLKKEDLDAIVKAGLYAPSAKNLQSTMLVAVQDADTIARLEERLASVQPADTVAAGDISREMAHVADHVGRVSMSKHIFYDVQGVPTDTALVVTVRPDSLSQGAVEYDRIEGWLRTRLKTDNVIVYIEEGEE